MNTIISSRSPITALGFVRIVSGNLVTAKHAAEKMGLFIDRIYGTQDKRYIEISCHQADLSLRPPRWTDEQRAQFAAHGF